MSRRALPFLLRFVASVGCGGGKPTAAEAKPEPTTATPPTVQQSDPNAPTADRTFAYWEGVAKAQEITARRYAALAEPKPDEVTKLLTDTAKGIDELPAEKVDPDAVAVGKALADGLRAEKSAATKALADAAGKARTTREALTKKYGREFPALDWPAAKDPAFRLARDLIRPTAAQELARMKGEVAKLDAEIKPLNTKLNEEITTRDRLAGEAESVRTLLKEQTSDADLKKARQQVLDDAVKDLEASKKVIDELTKQVSALRTKRGDFDRLANDLTAILKEGDPEKADAMPLASLERLRTLTERMNEKIDAQKK